MKKHRTKKCLTRKDKVNYGIIAFLVAFILLAFFIISFRKESSFDIKDSCGPIMNIVSHNVPNEGVCMTKCRFRCDNEDMKFSRVEFVEKQIGCHNCTCFCR